MSTPIPNTNNDTQRGKDALQYFHNRALNYPENYKLRYEELIQYLDQKYKGVFFDGFGFGIVSAGMTEGQVQQGMEALADQGKGRLPNQMNAYFNALIDPARSFSFSDAAREVIKGTARDLVEGAAATGKAVLSASSSLLTILPIALGAGVILFFYMKGKH